MAAVYQSTDPKGSPFNYESFPSYPQPVQPGFTTPYDPSQDNLVNPLSMQLNGINTQPLNQSVLNFADLANRNGPSAWATSAGQQQDALASNAMDRGSDQVAGQTAQAMDNLGSSGGMTSGARERVAEGGAKNYMNMSQDTSRQNSINHMQIGVNDQQNKMQEMGMLPGMETQALQPELQKATMWEDANKANVQNQISSTEYGNQFNQNIYQQQMQAWGANQQAQATEHSGKKG